MIEYNCMPEGMYFIEAGSCVVLRRSLYMRKERPIVNLKPSDHFGEISMLFNCPTFARVKSTKFSLLGRLNQKNFNTIITAFPGFHRAMRDEVSMYKSKWKLRLEAFLRETEYFAEMSNKSMTKLLYKCKLFQFDAHSRLFSEGDTAKGMWVIMTGVVALTFKIKGIDIPLKILKTGGILNYDFMALSTLYPSIQRRTESSALAVTFVTCAFL